MPADWRAVGLPDYVLDFSSCQVALQAVPEGIHLFCDACAICVYAPFTVKNPLVLWSAPPLADPTATPSVELESVAAALERRAPAATVEPTDQPLIRRLRWPTAGQPRVTIIVPTIGKEYYVRTLVGSLALTDYPNYELLSSTIAAAGTTRASNTCARAATG